MFIILLDDLPELVLPVQWQLLAFSAAGIAQSTLACNGTVALNHSTFSPKVHM